MGWFRRATTPSRLNLELASKIDHTLLKPEATLADVKKLCAEAAAHRFHSVCVAPCHVAEAARLLAKTEVKVCAVVGFPLGASRTEVKLYEARLAVKDGAAEIDMVLNIGWLKAGKHHAVKKEIRKIVKAVKRKAIVKVILECCLLTRAEKIKGAQLAMAARAAFVKTSTGFSAGGATPEDVLLLKNTVGERCGVKASGGIRTREAALAMLDAGADRLGCSHSVAIVREK